MDIIAIQEPSVNFLGRTVASRDWIPIYPSTHEKEQGKTRAITLMSSRIPTGNWEQIEFQSGDVVVIKITGNWGQLILFNIYNDCSHDRTLRLLTKFHRDYSELLTGNENEAARRHVIWMGDFNRHHPMWDRPDDHRLFTREALQAAETLIKATADHGMEMALAAEIPTHIHNVTKKWSRLDHVFITEHSTDRILICETRTHQRGLNTDHIPIVTKIDASLGRIETSKTKNFRNVDWKEFRETLEVKMSGFGIPRRLGNQAEVSRECGRLTEAIQSTIEQVVPTSVVCPHSKRWWSKELRELRTRFKKLGRKTSKYRNVPEHATHKEYREVRKIYDKAIKYNKRHHWRDWLEKATDPDIWTANKYITAAASDGGKTRIPALRQVHGDIEQMVSANHEKSKLLAKGFFPSKPPVNPNYPPANDYPEPACGIHRISREQIRRQLKRLKPYKAPGPDSIPNIVLTQCADLLTDRFFYIYGAILERGYCFNPWKQFTTVVLRKPGKP